MIVLSNVGISVDKGTIPRIYKQPFKLSCACISVDKGTIPPKNYFQTTLKNIGVFTERADRSKISYQIIN